MKQGVITLIPKQHKDTLIIDNWRPITLLNNDYKILALIITDRLKYGSRSLIDECQSGFMKNRRISNNIRLVLDLTDYDELLDDDPVILFLDFQKAFDCVSHQFIFDTLAFFGLGKPFINVIKILYKGGNSCVKLAHGTSPRFDIHKGVRQGCPASPYIFLLGSQILCALVNISQIKGIMFNDRVIKIAQLADDTTICLKNENEVASVISIINQFSLVSGLALNIEKCEMFPLKTSISLSVCGIPVKTTVTYLGIKITKDVQERKTLNLDPLITSVKNIFSHQWMYHLQRVLSWINYCTNLFGETKGIKLRKMLYLTKLEMVV